MESVLHMLVSERVDENGVDPDHLDLHTTNRTLIAMQSKYCKVGKCPIEWAKVQYQPTIPGNTVYLVCFIILLSLQLFLGIKRKTWTYTGVVSAGLLLETVGYIGRLMLHHNPFIMNNFLTNLIPLTIAPALLTAGIYICLGRVIIAIGSEISRLQPKMYTYIFVGCDLLSLGLQAIGGALAATAKPTNRSSTGKDVMVAGLICQVVSMAFFLVIWGIFALRSRRARLSRVHLRTATLLYADLRSTRMFQFFQWSLFVATILIFVRCLYRVTELWDGFGSHLANDEAIFMIFEGPLIILAVIAMSAFHPGRVFTHLWDPVDQDIQSIPLGPTARWKANTAYEHM